MKLEIEKSNKNELKRNLKQEGKSDKEAEGWVREISRNQENLVDTLEVSQRKGLK